MGAHTDATPRRPHHYSRGLLRRLRLTARGWRSAAGAVAHLAVATMTDIPIMFSTAMVLALLAGRKLMTRRLAWKDPVSFYDPEDDQDAQAPKLRRRGWKVSGRDDLDHRIGWPPTPWQKVKPGDRLWCARNGVLARPMKPRSRPNYRSGNAPSFSPLAARWGMQTEAGLQI